MSNRSGICLAICGPTAILVAGLEGDNGHSSGWAYLLDAAGASGKCPCDFDGNDDLRVSDLLLLLASWSSCP